jgi:diacylglycerol kinase
MHPGQAPFFALAKDCAAAAVMILSVCSVTVFLLMLAEVWPW